MPISKLTFVRTTVVAMLIGLGALITIVAINYWLVDRTSHYADTLSHARIARSAVIDLRTMMDDAETGQRGFLLTDNPDYLAPYVDATSKISGQIDKVKAAFDDDPVQTGTVNRLVTVVTEKLAELKATVDDQKSGDRDRALAEVRNNRGRELMDEARALFAKLLTRVEERITIAVTDQHDSIQELEWVTIGGALVILLVVGGSVWAVLLYTRQLVVARLEVQELNVNLEERVRERTADLNRANEEIQRFAYIVTHDLRAPLVNIMGFTSELEDCLTAIQSYVKQSDAASPNVADPDPVISEARAAALEDLPEAIGFIRSSTRKMDGLINAILKLSREGRRVLKPERIQLDALLEGAAANVHHQVAEAGGDVVIDSTVPPLVSDRLALEQIFGNLLDNAVKYRAPDRPLHIRIRAREQFGQRIVVEVEDNGRGIARQDHERVFDLFRRSGAQDKPGEGIGLAHVRTMIRNLGGEITLESDLARGTTMKLNLPRDLRRVASAYSGEVDSGSPTRIGAH